MGAFLEMRGAVVMFVRIRNAAAAAADEEKNCGQLCGDWYAWNELPQLTGGEQMVVVALWISWSTAATVVSRWEYGTGQ